MPHTFGPAPATAATDGDPIGPIPPAGSWRWRSIARHGLSWLPRQCEVCANWGRQTLCTECMDRLAIPGSRCPRCALPVAAPGPVGQACGDCLRHPHAFDRAVAVVDYVFPWDRLITRMKFHQRPDLARALAPALAETVLRAAVPRPDVLVPMPASRSRLIERGYNQAWELCRSLARQLHLPARDGLLVRGDGVQHQVGLTRVEREANLRHALWVEPARHAACAGRTMALIDDVMTTGASADAAAHALRLAGASSIQVWVVARTPLEG